MKKYVKLQIIKHAMLHYIQRADVTEERLKKEKQVLRQIETEILDLKRAYNIPFSECEWDEIVKGSYENIQGTNMKIDREVMEFFKMYMFGEVEKNEVIDYLISRK